MRYIRNCKYCGDMFFTNYHQQVYCCNSCRFGAEAKRHPKKRPINSRWKLIKLGVCKESDYTPEQLGIGIYY